MSNKNPLDHQAQVAIAKVLQAEFQSSKNSELSSVVSVILPILRNKTKSEIEDLVELLERVTTKYRGEINGDTNFQSPLEVWWKRVYSWAKRYREKLSK